MVLWHIDIEGQKPTDLAPLLGLTANSVWALAYRAREGLRQAVLTMRSGDVVTEACQQTHDLLSAFVRNEHSRGDSEQVEEHLARCRRCTAVYLELTEVNSSMAAVLGPAVLGARARWPTSAARAQPRRCPDGCRRERRRTARPCPRARLHPRSRQPGDGRGDRRGGGDCDRSDPPGPDGRPVRCRTTLAHRQHRQATGPGSVDSGRQSPSDGQEGPDCRAGTGAHDSRAGIGT